MSEIRDEPAFPNEWCNELGMSMRDYFAAKAMQGMCARVNWDAKATAETAYAIADAMLIIRAENE